jgi:hypothetical protein
MAARFNLLPETRNLHNLLKPDWVHKVTQITLRATTGNNPPVYPHFGRAHRPTLTSVHLIHDAYFSLFLFQVRPKVSRRLPEKLIGHVSRLHQRSFNN